MLFLKYGIVVMRCLFAATCLTLATASLAGCSTTHSVEKPTEKAVLAADAKVRVTPINPVRKTLVRYCEQPGQISALEQTPVFAKVSGYVRRVLVDIGDKVKGPVYDGNSLKEPGDLLAQIDVPELEKELAEKEALVRQSQSEIEQARAAVKVAEAMYASSQAAVDEAHATVERVDADYARWKSELARISDLASRQAVTDKLVDETQNKFRAAEATRKEVSAKIQSAKAHLAESEALIVKAKADVDATQAKLEVAEAERDRVQTLHGFAEIRAPFDGVVAERGVDTGHLVNAGAAAKEALFVIVRPETVRIFVDVPEIDAVHIQTNAEANIRMPSLAGDGVQGKVTRTAWVLNQATRTLRTEIDVPNEEGRLRPGMYAYARLKVAERPDVLTLPKSALMIQGGQTSCWRIETDGTLRRTVIQTGLESGGEYEIVSGLNGDENIIGVNVGAFREGQQVEIVAPQSKTST
jgi:RND family efflux transporter MFP subunit